MSYAAYIPLLLQGIGITIGAWIFASTLSICIGLLLGITSSNLLASPTSRFIIRIYTFTTKGIPAYVQILLMYFALPALLHVNISGFLAASCALAICSSGYVTEIIRGGMNSIPTGQWQACKVLGYSTHHALYRIILPQVFKNVLPALFGECEQLLKSTSLLATIGVMELTRAGMNIISRELNPIAIYLAIAMIYLVLSALVQICLIYFEKRSTYGYRY